MANQGVGPWHITEAEPYTINDVFRQIEEQVNLLRGLGASVSISIALHTHAGASSGGVLDHGALGGLADNDHPQYLLATAVTTDEAVEEATGHDRVSDQVMVGDNLTLTEQADGSGDAVLLDVNTATVITTANTDWVDLTDSGATTLHSHGGATAETDQALYDAQTAEHITDEVFVDDTLILTELADGSGDAIQLAVQPNLLLDDAQAVSGRVSDQVMVGTGLTLTELAEDSGDAIQLAVDSTVITTTNADWVDLTDSGATTLHSHAGGSEAFDVGLAEVNDYGTDDWERVSGGLADFGLAIDSTSRPHIQGQNRFRYLNSMVHAEKSTTQTINNNTWTVVTFDVEEFDTDGLHDTVTNNSRLTAQITGKYIVACCLSFASNATGIRKLTIEKGSAGVQTSLNIVGMSGTFATTPGSAFMTVGAVTELAAGEYVELFGFQNSGAGLGIEGVGTWGHVTFLALIYVGE